MLYIGIDLGTSATKTVLFDITGKKMTMRCCPSRKIRRFTTNTTPCMKTCMRL